MTTAITVILLSLLAAVVFQDFKHRAISWFLIPLLFIGFVAYALLSIDVYELLTYFSINSYIVLSCLLGVTAIISFKEKKFTNILKNHLGLGDALFFLVLTVVFSPLNFLAFYVGSIFISCLIYLSILLLNKNKQSTFPLAGGMSLMLMVIIITTQFIPSLNFYQDLI